MKINWEVRNGPSVYVTVEDMFNDSEVGLTGLESDNNTQHWHVRTWEDECVQVNSEGCDVLRAKIEKGDWTDWDDSEDIDFNAKAYQIQLITELDSIQEEYSFEEFTFSRAFDDAV